MNALQQEIAVIIAEEGPISLERYMSLCLSHPRLGYYTTHNPFGASGDFITAPEISQMFGELLGVWMIEAWTAAGNPEASRLVELGPGRGTLMSDVLRVARIAPNFLANMAVDLVETSPLLRDLQRQMLAGETVPISWRADFGEVPRAPVFVLANEFFDALPARHFVKTATGWRERLVGLDRAGALVFGLAPNPEPGLAVPAPEGSVIEVNGIAQRLMAEIAERIVADGGVMLAVDYGYAQTTLGESLQAVARHGYVDPLQTPGEADLTTHVDFAALKRAAMARGAKVQGPVGQGAFLKQLGIERRAEALMKKADAGQREDIASALARLAGSGDPRERMGDLFKAMAIMHPDTPDLPGFAE
ncbi:class I SAM-dependent methyltransferase [Methylocystis heyeri]|uniref:Class I SAM-dependent methyltransferase n=1 Tax=Methylocystis heyeri TaxID=391905 RepID=A0A6B8KL21_9HYPH|nr:SAM-dependent methyltransferase [Methylocystis heyeri]QGM47408.1 class I SAM-dependent methyltransferase [Methylocystis heyeri]